MQIKTHVTVTWQTPKLGDGHNVPLLMLSWLHWRDGCEVPPQVLSRIFLDMLMETSGCPGFGFTINIFFYRWMRGQITWSVGSTDLQKGTHQAFSGLGFWHAWNNNWDCRPHYLRANVPHPILPQISQKSARLLVRSGSWFPLLEQGKQGSLQSMLEGITEERWGSNSAKGKKDMPNHNKSKTSVFLCKQVQGNGFVWQGKMWAETGNWVRSQRNYKQQNSLCDQE